VFLFKFCFHHYSAYSLQSEIDSLDQKLHGELNFGPCRSAVKNGMDVTPKTISFRACTSFKTVH